MFLVTRGIIYHSPFIPQLAPLGFTSLVASFILREIKRNVVNPVEIPKVINLESYFLPLLNIP